MTFQTVELFGGGIVADLPSTFKDVSDIRQVPDHQEVYLDSEGYTSIVVEILERVDQSDQDALRHHLDDLVETDASETTLVSTAQAHFDKLPPGTPAYTLIAVAPPDEKQRGRDHEPDFVAIYLTMLRLPQQDTDLLIVINVPFVKDNYDAATVNKAAGQFGALGDNARSFQDQILRSFEIKDWALFGE